MYEVKIGTRLRQLNTYLIRYGKENMEGLDMTSAQSMLLDYLLLDKKKEYHLKDICSELGLAKATVSVMLKALRENGYLEMTADPEDDRKRKITLSHKAFDIQEELENKLKNRGNCIFRGITEQEVKNLESTLDRMIANLKEKTEKEAKIW